MSRFKSISFREQKNFQMSIVISLETEIHARLRLLLWKLAWNILVIRPCIKSAILQRVASGRKFRFYIQPRSDLCPNKILELTKNSLQRDKYKGTNRRSNGHCTHPNVPVKASLRVSTLSMHSHASPVCQRIFPRASTRPEVEDA